MRPARGILPFFDTVYSLAAKHGLDVEINDDRLPGYGANVLVKRRSAEVSVSLALLTQPAAVQDFAAAHEIAHVVLRHTYWRRILPAVACSQGRFLSLDEEGFLRSIGEGREEGSGFPP